ncbi:MAG: septum formation inhibitor Maf [Christensenellaceae bacterium]|nr:septum formation inhibitor Maf [Christensenellaceae bacterium]
MKRTSISAPASLSGRRVILASGSPRRKELLTFIVPEFDVIPSDIDETASGSPEQQVEKLAADKAADIARQFPDAVVIGADTLVTVGGRVLGKPRDAEEAAAMLHLLSGRDHIVYTGVAVASGGAMRTAVESTRVIFSSMTDDEIREYISTGEPMDKAGAYGIQGYGGKYITGIEGCFFNVMGLPLNRLYNMLKSL